MFHILWQSEPETKRPSLTSPKLIEFNDFKSSNAEDLNVNVVDVIFMQNVTRKAIIHVARYEAYNFRAYI
jgi:hypothetical protein